MLSVRQARAFAVSLSPAWRGHRRKFPLTTSCLDAASESIATEKTDDSAFPVIVNLEAVRDGALFRFGRVGKATLFLA
jgi:hypothetical protein